MVEEIMATAGVKCSIYSTATDALEASHSEYEYAFIIVSRTLEDISGDIFLNHFELKHGIGNALTILLTSNEDTDSLREATKSNYTIVLNKQGIGSIQDLVVQTINTQILHLDANILLVEDSLSIANQISALFKSNGSKIQHVDCLSNMISAFQENEFDLVITDYYISDTETGDDVISYIRHYDETDKAHTPIIVVSGESNQKKRISFLRNGANDVIIKPHDNDELLVRASNLVANKKLYEQSKKQQHQLMKMALTDHLTGLYNRHSLYDIAPKYISNSHRHKTHLSLLVIDIDHFKRINDTRGHSTGDAVLKSISTLLKSTCRTEDMVARFGGEEFVMLLTNCNIDNAVLKAERVRKAIEERVPEELTVTCSIGASEITGGDDFDSLFKRADKAVYKAKEAGRNCVMSD